MPIDPQPAFEYADSSFLFLQHCCMFVFSLLFGRLPLSFVCEMCVCDRVGNEMPGKRNIWSRKRWVQVDNKNDGGRTSPVEDVTAAHDIHPFSTLISHLYSCLLKFENLVAGPSLLTAAFCDGFGGQFRHLLGVALPPRKHSWTRNGPLFDLFSIIWTKVRFAIRPFK